MFKKIINWIPNTVKKIKTALSKIKLELFFIVLTAFLTALFTYYADVKFDDNKIEENTKKIQQIVNAEIIENLEIANKYSRAKNQIVSDVEFVSFLQVQRFYTDSLRDLMADNFQYLSENDLYHLAVIRDKMNILNKKFDKLEAETQRPRISSKPECNFLYFLPEDKYWKHRSLSDDFNRMFYSIKQLSFFPGNPFPDLKDEFEITYAKVSVYYFDYSDEYKDVDVLCD